MNSENGYDPEPPSNNPQPGWQPSPVLGYSCLVLVFIIIIPAIIFPISNRLREKARSETCRSNLKSVGTMILMYAQDYNMTYPPPDRWIDANTAYIKSYRVLTCPSQENKSLPGYGMDSLLKGVALTRVTEPANTVMLFDAKPGKNPSGDTSALTPTPRHMGGDNIVYADTTAIWVKRSAVAHLNWDPISGANSGVGRHSRPLP